MNIADASVTFTTFNLSETRGFYERHFDAKAVFDCGWYVVLRLPGADKGAQICLKDPCGGEPAFAGGATVNLHVPDADALHTRLTQQGLEPIIPLEDHPWGDRGFGVVDPCGVVVYCYHDIEPSTEFMPCFVEQD